LKRVYQILVIFFLFSSCSKKESIIVDNNNAPNYNGISTIRIQNYINRLFIDLLGREPTNSEKDYFTGRLKHRKLETGIRDSIVNVLQNDTNFRIGDSSYRIAYSQRMYELMKLQFLEGASEPDLQLRIGNLNFAIQVARLNGDSVAVQQYLFEQNKYLNVTKSKYRFSRRIIDYPQFIAAMLNNGIYDQINMGSFNFVNAIFEDVLGRKPMNEEFQLAYNVIEKNEPALIFNQMTSNKTEVIQALVNSSAFDEAQIRWWNFQYLRTEISSDILSKLLGALGTGVTIEDIQRELLITDHYAQF